MNRNNDNYSNINPLGCLIMAALGFVVIRLIQWIF